MEILHFAEHPSAQNGSPVVWDVAYGVGAFLICWVIFYYYRLATVGLLGGWIGRENNEPGFFWGIPLNPRDWNRGGDPARGGNYYRMEN